MHISGPYAFEPPLVSKSSPVLFFRETKDRPVCISTSTQSAGSFRRSSYIFGRSITEFRDSVIKEDAGQLREMATVFIVRPLERKSRAPFA
ncbi:hypothetical protein BDZ89DRAFT_812779 [Hymenopellis radicata]|nr:hypothetical protein BDZ89DRAFT_812779 [Hymenopellis radicata]